VVIRGPSGPATKSGPTLAPPGLAPHPTRRVKLGRSPRPHTEGRTDPGLAPGGRPLRASLTGEIAERLHAALGALGAGARDAPARQQTLRATIDWSHDLLTDAEKACFARFAVFAGGATPQAAESVTASDLDMLDRVVAKKLLARRPHAQPTTRLAMLETIRAYAAERFAAAADKGAVHERHYRCFLAVVADHATDQGAHERRPRRAPRPARRRDRQPPRGRLRGPSGQAGSKQRSHCLAPAVDAGAGA